MHPLARTVLRDFLVVLAISQIVMAQGIIAFNALDVLLRRGLLFHQVLQAVPFLLPWVLRSAMQAAVLFATCFVFGRMAAKNELLALNALGLPVSSVLWPVVLVSVPLSLACVWVDDLGATWGLTGLERLIHRGAVDIIYNQLQTTRSSQFDRYNLVVKGVDGRQLLRPILSKGLPHEPDFTVAKAERGELYQDRRSSNIVLELCNGTVSSNNGFKFMFRDEITQSVSLAVNHSQAATVKRLAEQQQLVDELASKVAASAVEPPPVGAPEVSEESDLVSKLDAERKTLAQIRTQLHQKWSNSFCCLTFVLIGIPIAIWLRKADFLESFFICFLPIVLLYQPLQMMICSLAPSGAASPWWLWMNNGIVGTVGAAFIWRLVRTH